MSHPAFLAFSPAVSRIIEITASLIRDDEEFLRYKGLLFYVEDLLSDLIEFQPRLICAEDSQLKGNPVRDSVERIRLAVYDAEDAIDSIAIEASLWKRKKQGGDFPSTHLSWGMDVKHKISQLSYELNDLDYAYLFRLPIGVDDPAILKFQRRRSAEVLVDTGVFGRDVEREKIIDLLLLDHSETVAITGEGGIGKTTVAQLVYNDKRVKKFFQSSRRWIAVTDEIDLARILAGMIDSYALSPGLVDAGSQNILPGKRFLIVLDDVELRGFEAYTIEELLWRILDLGDKGSKVLVTSRREEAGFTLSKLPPFGLQRLPENDCWSLFQAIALDNVTDPLRKDLEVSGKEIVARCEGYPLAVKVMGNHLRGNTDVDDWNAILRSKIWYKYGPSSNLHPALYFNYYCLASHLKQCFAFCSLFPKNYVFNKKELVKLWMAEDFIHSKGEGNEEEIGAQYFDELLDRSFFQSFKIDNGGVIYKMHDVIRDLAQSISNPDYCQIESNNYSRWSHYRHVSICGIHGARSLMGFSHLETLHTILFLSGEGFKFFPDLEDLFGSLKYIRVLVLSSSMLVELPESIGKCIMLRYLDLSNNPFKRLPRSICYLPNLQTLKLLLCTRLSRLPKNLHNLVNLRYLELDDVNWFNWPMPPKIGKLTILQNLPAFHVGLGRGYKIKELKDMASLTGSLHISRLEYAVNASEAKLNEKVRLQKLVFEWCDKDIIQGAAERILEDLQPHQNIEELQIWNYQGTCVPTWIQNGLLQNLAVLTLKHCIKCRILSLGLLTGLRELCIKGLLELEEWTDLECPALQRLEISDCPLINSFPTGRLPASLQFLVIQNCPRLSERCQVETGPEWWKIAHIPDLEIDPTNVLAPALLKEEQPSSTSDVHFIGIGEISSEFKVMEGHTEKTMTQAQFGGKASASSSSTATDLPEAISSRFQELEKTTEAGCSKATSSAEPKILQIQEMHAESHHSALEPAAMLSDTSLEATAPLSRLIKDDRILNEILSRIGDSKTRIGVYGGAVGKTTLLKSLKVHPDIREMFQFVIWVTVPKVWKLEEVQLEIAKQLPLSDKKSISSWKLMSFLNKVKFLLILDGVHQVISLDFIGIPDPTPENGCNIVLTAVSEEICDRMEVDWKINLEGLLKEFCENAGKIDYSSDLQPLALEVVDLCGYHWHAIFLMSKALKDEYDVCVWNNAIEILRKQPAFPGRDLENIMADVLKFSYSRLPDDTTRRCLKNCALFFENQEIARDSLIDNWMSDDLTDMYSKGQKVLETLVTAGLVECSEDGQVFKLREIDRYLLVEHVFPSMEGLFLMRNDSRLTELPKDVYWTKLCEIYLIDNELTELSDELSCPQSQAFFLQRNLKLRKISDIFFQDMLALQILNLSGTPIKSLPDSLFGLVNLKRFSLNHCVLLKLLPSGIGNLNCLEVFHLEGTAIVALPREVEQLTNLTSLKVSFREHVSLDHPRKMIPDGVIPQLSKLKNLYIDVSPEDERWKASVESVALEICTLTILDTLQFYFPNMKLLNQFNWDSIPISPPLSHFRFTVGDHTSRIIRRLPREAELELVRYDKCLKYVNGEGAPKEIKKVLRHASAFFLDRNMTIEKLSEFEISNMMQLKCCVAGECDKLQSILDGDQMVIGASEVVVGFESLECLYIYYAKSLRSICEGRLDNSSFKKLKYLTLYMCPELTIVFTLELLGNLSRLEEFTVDDCSNIRRLVQYEDVENEIKHVLPALKKISLHFLPELDSISDVLSIAPKIKWMSFYYCPNLKNLPISKAFHTKLEQIKGEKSWWQALEWQNTEQDSKWKDIFVGVDEGD